MTLLDLLVPAVVTVVGVVLLALGARERWFALRVYRGEPFSVVQTANDPGPVEVVGTAQPEEGTVESPFSGTACLICEWEVQQSESTGGKHGGTHWKTLASGLRGGPFRLEDDTASCRVEPSGSARHLERHDVTVPAGTTAPTRIQEFVDAHPDVEPQDESVDVGIAGIALGTEQRFIERRLDPGEDCYVYGRAHYDSTAGSRAGEINVRIDGDGIRWFLIADSRERGVAFEQVKIGVLPAFIGVALIVFALALGL